MHRSFKSWGFAVFPTFLTLVPAPALGAEAVRLCAQTNPDAVLMDIRMPVMDGLEATRQIRSSGSQVPIIAVTAFAYDRDRQKALDAGCNEYLAKPLTGDKLRQTLRQLLRNG